MFAQNATENNSALISYEVVVNLERYLPHVIHLDITTPRLKEKVKSIE
jgi:hypothetical protein